ncbi:HAD family hydrolase [bacterium AH-315-J04]|nr:HAD family hydrolase [bacterium AH-315-J04]
MRFIIELEGPVFDIKDAHFAAYQKAVAEAGWSSLDQATFWRLWRKQGLEASLLMGATALKIKQFWGMFQAALASQESMTKLALQGDISLAISSLQRFGFCVGVTTGNATLLDEYSSLLAASKLAEGFVSCKSLPAEPRQRASQLGELAAGDERTVLIASSDIVARAGSSAAVFTVGVPNGCCHSSRLHSSGADIVYKGLADVLASLDTGATDMIQAGLKPASLG